MTPEEKAKDVYIRCFDDNFEYVGVLHALEICAEEVLKELKVQLDFMECACDGAAEMYNDLKVARELIENIIRVTWGEGWNYSLDWKVKAEQFLKETER